MRLHKENKINNVLPDDEIFDTWIKQKFHEETADIIDNLKDDPDVDGLEPSEELYKKINEKAK